MEVVHSEATHKLIFDWVNSADLAEVNPDTIATVVGGLLEMEDPLDIQAALLAGTMAMPRKEDYTVGEDPAGFQEIVDLGIEEVKALAQDMLSARDVLGRHLKLTDAETAEVEAWAKDNPDLLRETKFRMFLDMVSLELTPATIKRFGDWAQSINQVAAVEEHKIDPHTSIQSSNYSTIGSWGFMQQEKMLHHMEAARTERADLDQSRQKGLSKLPEHQKPVVNCGQLDDEGKLEDRRGLKLSISMPELKNNRRQRMNLSRAIIKRVRDGIEDMSLAEHVKGIRIFETAGVQGSRELDSIVFIIDSTRLVNLEINRRANYIKQCRAMGNMAGVKKHRNHIDYYLQPMKDAMFVVTYYPDSTGRGYVEEMSQFMEIARHRTRKFWTGTIHDWRRVTGWKSWKRRSKTTPKARDIMDAFPKLQGGSIDTQ